MTSPRDHLERLGLTLPAVPTPAGAYVPVRLLPGLAITAGMLPMRDGAVAVSGLLGDTVDVAGGRAAAQLAALNGLAALEQALGSLERIRAIVRVEGFVAATAAFRDHPAVLNGASELLLEVFGEAGRHTRAAVGVASLPRGAAVELSLWVQI